MKVGNRVINTKNDYEGRIIDTVTERGSQLYLVEYDKHMGGHDGFPTEYGDVIGGKMGHCWYVNSRFLRVIEIGPTMKLKKHKFRQDGPIK